MNLSKRDEARLVGVHPDLVRVVRKAASLSGERFMVIQGLRTPEEQAQLVKSGKSRTQNSRHLTGHAVDLAPLLPDGSIPWAQWDRFAALADVVACAAVAEQVPVQWGGEAFGPGFKDGPHFQLPHAVYPAKVAR